MFCLLSIACAMLFADPDAKADGEVPWLDAIQSQPSVLPNDAPELRSVTSGVTTLAQWRHRRSDFRSAWLNFLGPLATADRQTPQLKVVSGTRHDGVIRQLVEYESGSGDVTRAYLLRPETISGKTAGVVVFHSTVDHSIRQPAGVEGKAEKAFGWKLAKQGYVTYCPRNFLWPTDDKIEAAVESAALLKRHPDSKGMAKMLYDAMLAVDILVAQPNVDSQRIGAIGHSLGAKEVLYLAAFDERVKVSVSSEGGIGTRFSNWEAPWYLSNEIRGKEFVREHDEVLALVPPRAFLLVGGDSADGDRSWPFIQSVLPVYRLYQAPPRLGLYNHRRGHSVPPSAEQHIYEWMATYLPPGKKRLTAD